MDFLKGIFKGLDFLKNIFKGLDSLKKILRVWVLKKKKKIKLFQKVWIFF